MNHLPLMLLDLLDGFPGNAAMEGHKIHTVFRVKPYHVDEILGRQCGQVPLVMDHAVIHRHSADHSRALTGELLTEGLGIAVGRQVHNGLCPHVHRRHNFLHFHVVIFAISGNTQVLVVYCQQSTMLI